MFCKVVVQGEDTQAGIDITFRHRQNSESLGQTEQQELFRQKEIYGAVAVKMCLFPLVFYEICQFLQVPHDIILTMSILPTLPSMAVIGMLAQNQRSAGNYAAGMLLVTTLCSIVTIPLVCLGLG